MRVRFHRFFSEESQGSAPEEKKMEASPLPPIVNDTANNAASAPVTTSVNETSNESAVKTASEITPKDATETVPAKDASEATPAKDAAETPVKDAAEASTSASAEPDKAFIENLLSSLSVETKTQQERKQLVYDFATIMMDPSFKQLFNSLSKSLPAYYLDDLGLLPVVKKEFIARIQEELIKGSFLPPENDLSLQGLSAKKRAITANNQIIHSAEDETPMKLPIPSWIMQELDDTLVARGATSAPVAQKSETEAESSRAEKAPIYDANRNNEIEEFLDRFGTHPLRRNASGAKETHPRGEHVTGSFITKHVQVTKEGVRVAYGGGKRKNASARVYVRAGTGAISVNGSSLVEYFPMGSQRDQVLAPLAVAQRFGAVDVWARVSGGGMTGQAEAVRLALAKALATYESGLGHVLSLAGLLTADPRVVERKKPGHTKARRPQQWVKR